MEYPEEFSSQGRARVEAARLKAGNDLEQYRNKTKARPRRQHTSGPYGLRWTEEEEDLHEYVLRVARAYGHEGCEIGLLGVWTAERIRSEVVEFRRKFTIEALSEKGYNKFGSRFPDMVSDWDGSLLPDVRRTFDESIEWHQFEEELLAVAERQAAQNCDQGGPVGPIIDDRAKFLQGAVKHPNLFAHWDSLQKRWTYLDRPVDEQGKPDPYQSVLADPEAVRLLKEAARIALSLLRHSRDPDTRALASTLREPQHVWLDLMKAKERGFQRVPQLTHWRGGKPMEAFMESGAVPPDARLTENGVIHRVFLESANLWGDLTALGFETEAPAPASNAKNGTAGGSNTTPDPEQAERARVRQAVVMPILGKKNWTRSKWATQAGVSKNSVYEYLDGRRSLSDANRKPMAEVLDLNPKQLPK
jgi:hypothetical protein